MPEYYMAYFYILQADIDDEKLMIALEPEAASIFCQYLEDKQAYNKRSLLNETGQKYMIIDLGGNDCIISYPESVGPRHLHLTV